MNPCPCGFFNVPSRECSCKEQRVYDYHQRVSGPLMDRIDISIQTRPVARSAMLELGPQGRDSHWYRERVEAARERQRDRFRRLRGIHCNAQMGPLELRRFCRLPATAKEKLEKAVKQHAFSARAHDRIVKLARTKADLEGRETIADDDVTFAIDLRMLDRQGWLVGGSTSYLAAKYGRLRTPEKKDPEQPAAESEAKAGPGFRPVLVPKPAPETESEPEEPPPHTDADMPPSWGPGGGDFRDPRSAEDVFSDEPDDEEMLSRSGKHLVH